MRKYVIMLSNFYIKAGAPERESELIGSLFGEQYFEYKKKHRIEGAGNKAKALAAAEICDYIATGAGLYSDFMIWDMYKDPKSFEKVVNIVGAANICRAAVYAYALDVDATETILADGREFLRIASGKANAANIPFDYTNRFDALKQQVQQTSISAAAMGSKWGIWSTILR
ncbi:MAG: hypothetical protein ABGX37_07545 [Methylococcales bacterium]